MIKNKRRDFPIGFIDMVAYFEVEMTAGIYDIGHPSPHPNGTFGNNTGCYKVGFEVKPIITSLGELLRQLKTYEILVPLESWFVVSPKNDLARKALLREQFGMIDVPDEILAPPLSTR